jgi:hypothetical protein
VELESIKARGVMEPVTWEVGMKAIDTKVIFDEKMDEKGLITSLKARLVAKGLGSPKGRTTTKYGHRSANTAHLGWYWLSQPQKIGFYIRWM